MPDDSQITGTVSKDLAWARHHLFLLVAVAVLTVGSIYGIETVLANRAHEAFLQQQAILQQFQQQNQKVQEQTQAEITALNSQNGVLQQQLTQLTAAIAARDAQLMKDRAAVKTLPPPQLATKWGALADEPAPQIDANGDFLVPLPLAQKSVDALLTVPVLEQDKKDLQTQLTNETQIAVNNDTKFTNEQKAHESDKETCKQTVVTKDAEIKDLKAQGRKRNILIAIIAGALGFGLHR